MLLELAAHIAIDTLNLAIGVYVLLRNPRDIVHRSFFLFVLGIVGWSVSMMLLSWTGWIWLTTLPFWGAELMVLGFMLLAEFFPDGITVRTCFLCMFLSWFAVVIVTSSDLVVRTAQFNVAGYITPEHGPLFPLFGVVMGACILWGVATLFLKYRRLQGIRRVQMRYLAAGAGAFLFFAFLTNVVLPLFHVFQFNLIGPLFSIIFVGAAAYAIVRHQFMDVRVVIQRGLLYASSIVLIACIFFGIDFLIRQFVHGEGWSDDVIAAVVGAFGFVWFRRFFERVTDPIFFREDYHHMAAIHELGPLLHSTIDLDMLLRALDGFLARTVKPERVVFVIGRGEREQPLVRPFSRGAQEDAPDEIIALAAQASGPVFFQEHMREDGGNGNGDIAAIIPFVSHEGRSTTMLLGKKLSGDIFRTKDIELLSVIAHHAGMAIENAELYAASLRYGEELEARVAVRTDELKKMQEAQSKFVTDISHELQTPVAVLTANMEVLEKKRAGSKKMALSVVSATVARMAQMVEHLLAIARLNFSKEKLHKTEIAVENLLEDAYNDCAILAEDQGVTLSYAGDPVRIMGDKDRLKEVILNLLSNALKHTPRGGKIVLLGKRVGEHAEISVGDTGSGIPTDKLPHVFERFYRISTDDCPGSGIGLDICKQIVEMHGGTIRVESALGEGTVFIVSLPFMPQTVPSEPVGVG